MFRNQWSRWLRWGQGTRLAFGYFLFFPGGWLIPAGLYPVMSPVLENTKAKFYARSARLIPPLIDHFSENGHIRIHFLHLSPNCLQPYLLERANPHALKVLTNSDPQNIYWGFVKRNSKETDKGGVSFVVKGAQSVVTLKPAEQMYADKESVIVRASLVTVKTDERICAVGPEP